MRGKHRRYWKKARRDLKAGALRAVLATLVTESKTGILSRQAVHGESERDTDGRIPLV